VCIFCILSFIGMQISHTYITILNCLIVGFCRYITLGMRNLHTFKDFSLTYFNAVGVRSILHALIEVLNITALY
jgi:hypothetical protein